MAMPVRAVVFDLDGTLIDNSEYERRNIEMLVEEAVKATGSSREEVMRRVRDYRVFRGTPLWYDWRHFCRFIGAPEDAWIRVHLENVELLKPMPEALDTLKALRGRYGLAVVSDALRKVLDIKLEATGISSLIDASVSQEEAGAVKPDPSGLLMASRILDVDPAECVFVGNMGDDVEAGLRAGMTTVLYPTGISGHTLIVEASEELSVRPHHVISRLGELVELLGRL